MRVLPLLFFLLISLLVPATAYAQDVQDHPAVQILDLATEVLVPVLTLMAILLYRKLAKKWGVEVTHEHEQLIGLAVAHGAGWAEESARKALRGKGHRWQADEKLSAATEAALRYLREHQVPEVAREELTKRIEAWLGTQRIRTGDAVGVTEGGSSEGGIFSGPTP